MIMVKVRVQVVINDVIDDVVDVFVGGVFVVDLPVVPSIGTIINIGPVVSYDVFKDVFKDVEFNGLLFLERVYRSVFVRVVGCTVVNGEVYSDNVYKRGWFMEDYDESLSDDDFEDSGYFGVDGVFNCFVSDLLLSDFGGLLGAVCWLKLCCNYDSDVFCDISGGVLSEEDQVVFDRFVEWFDSVVGGGGVKVGD